MGWNCFVCDILPWLLSAATILYLWLMGNKNQLGLTIGMAMQFAWVYFYAYTRQWGLIPLSVFIVIVLGRNLILWRRQEYETRRNRVHYSKC
jgi:hypothetical protein